MGYSQAAEEKIFAFRLADEEKREALPRLARYFLVRDSAHVSHIAGTLAASEMSSVKGAHVDATWSLVRRAGLDTLELLQVPASTVHALMADLDAAISSITKKVTPQARTSSRIFSVCARTAIFASTTAPGSSMTTSW